MKVIEVVVEESVIKILGESANAKVTIRGQILTDVQRNGGSANEYFIRFTDIDKLGYSARQTFARTRDVDDPKFDVDAIGSKEGKPALWFYPLSTYLRDKNLYASSHPYVWLVRIKPTAWLQTVKADPIEYYDTVEKAVAPKGKERVGFIRQNPSMSSAVFFKPAFTVVGKYYDYGSQHQRHGQVKGAPKPTFFQRIRGEAQ